MSDKKKYIVHWNAGYGSSYEVVEAESEDQAQNEAYELWREDVESHADYGVMPYTEENCDNYGLDWDGEEENT